MFRITRQQNRAAEIEELSLVGSAISTYNQEGRRTLSITFRTPEGVVYNVLLQDDAEKPQEQRIEELLRGLGCHF